MLGNQLRKVSMCRPIPVLCLRDVILRSDTTLYTDGVKVVTEQLHRVRIMLLYWCFDGFNVIYGYI